MNTDDMTGSLMFATLGIGLLIAAALLIYFLRKRSNRAPMESQREHNVGKEIDEGTRG